MKTIPDQDSSSAAGECLLTKPLLTAFLLSLPGLRVSSYWRLQEHIGDLQLLFNWPLGQLLKFLPPAAHPAFADFYRQRQQSSHWQSFVALCQPLLDDGVTILTHLDGAYPPLLRTISEPPPVLYVRGDVAALATPQLALVGSRNATNYGRDVAFNFSRYLAGLGLAVTSGLAAGIDGQAHRGALAAGGVTLAILGTGIDQIYPARHQRLGAEILATGGALVSEFVPGTLPHARNFPRRNRIISGLSLGVLVVEAALRSGSLITARYALEQNRDVFAIPGSINSPLSRGCHALLRDGATLVETAEDIGRELSHWLHTPAVVSEAGEAGPDPRVPDFPPQVEGAVECALWNCLDYEPCDVDRLVEQSRLAASEVLALLCRWQLLGLVQKQDEGFLRAAGY